MAEKPEKSIHKNKSSKFTSKDHNIRKRPPIKYETGESIIYVSTRSDVKALKEKCEKLIKQNENEIIIYCLGAAIQRGIVLALQLCENHVSYRMSVNTLTTELTDDLEPAADEADYEIQKRNNSALRIKIFSVDLLETEKRRPLTA